MPPLHESATLTAFGRRRLEDADDWAAYADDAAVEQVDDDAYAGDDDADDGGHWSSTEESFSTYFVIFLSLMAMVLVLCKLLHDRPRLQSVLPEAGMTVIVGIVSSTIIALFVPKMMENEADEEWEQNDKGEIAKGLLSFSSTFFFEVLLPPILFNSGYHVNRLFFFRHIRPIILYSIVGTFMNILVMAGLLQLLVSNGLTGGFTPRFSELLTFGSLIASTDPVSTLAVFQKKQVDPQLFYLVFGESVLNDGVCLVLFDAFSKLVAEEENHETAFHASLKILTDFLISFSGSLVLGVLCGVFAALLLKMVDMRKTQLLELSLYVLVMYFPFFLADAVGLSGIVAILFAGISAKRYAEPNLSIETETEADVLFRVTAHLAETAIFLELGLSVFGLGLSSFDDLRFYFIGWSLLACLLGRACSIYPITFLVNFLFDRKAARKNKDPQAFIDVEGSIAYSLSMTSTTSATDESDLKVAPKTAHMLWFSGLRGAVAYACAKNFPNDYGNRREFIVITMMICLVTVFMLGGTTELFLNMLKIDTGVDEDEYMEARGNERRGGFLKRVDENYICPRVIRNFNGGPELAERDQVLLSAISESARELMRTSHVEMTLDDHEHILRSMHMDLVSAASFSHKKRSLYDFGG